MRDRIVYFITDGRFVKIGVTSNLDKRLASLQTANAARLRVIRTLPGDEELEAKLHGLFSEHRLEGEWFNITEEAVVSFCDQLSPAEPSAVVQVSDASAQAVLDEAFLTYPKLPWRLATPGLNLLRDRPDGHTALLSALVRSIQCFDARTSYLNKYRNSFQGLVDWTSVKALLPVNTPCYSNSVLIDALRSLKDTHA